MTSFLAQNSTRVNTTGPSPHSRGYQTGSRFIVDPIEVKLRSSRGAAVEGEAPGLLVAVFAVRHAGQHLQRCAVDNDNFDFAGPCRLPGKRGGSWGCQRWLAARLGKCVSSCCVVTHTHLIDLSLLDLPATPSTKHLRSCRRNPIPHLDVISCRRLPLVPINLSVTRVKYSDCAGTGCSS